MKRLLTLAAILATLGLPPAAAWEREAFEALKQITREQTERKRAAKEQAEQEQAEQERAERERAAREQAAKEQAAREEAAREEAAKEQAAREQAERERAEQARREQAAKQEREQAAKQEQAQADAGGVAILPCWVFPLLDYARSEGALGPEVEQEYEQGEVDILRANCTGGTEPPADSDYADPRCAKPMFAMKKAEERTMELRQEAAEAESHYNQMKYAKSVGLLTPSQEMTLPKLKKESREAIKAWKASQRKFEKLYRAAEAAGCDV